MLQKILNNKIRIIQLFFLILLLVLVRAFENQLFYDPFLDFFKQDFTVLPLPDVSSLKLFLGLLLRYTLNTSISLSIIYVLFREIKMIKFAFILYCFFFLILIFLLFFIIYFTEENHNWLLFYVRRFLIQPIFLMLFIAGFYYQRINY
ncbi:exosortase F-associated protein [Flavobacterium micromati]|uniref:Exosortase F-associated protein n=1 Tax=Flavobacterium micromati TaxID=229205 RepID=A0A1M5M4N7_9FLAO|nr:exosortase F system-associated protein [Flavobacterium micromati]SHG72274.1 exosortase F-associated protein [Flavobacterium micromati]